MPALTAHSVEKIKPADARAEIVDALVPGLRLVVQPTGVKSWALRYSFGRRHRIGKTDLRIASDGHLVVPATK